VVNGDDKILFPWRCGRGKLRPAVTALLFYRNHCSDHKKNNGNIIIIIHDTMTTADEYIL